jgi:hypothetical protein
MPGEDLDLKFEKALAGHLRASFEETASCLDAETQAAYQEGALPETQLLRAKEHIATCKRCQEIVSLAAEPADAVATVAWSAGENVVKIDRRETASAAVIDSAGAAAVVASANPAIVRRRSLRVTQWRWLAPAGSIAALLILWLATHSRNSVPPIDVARQQRGSTAPSSSQNLASNQNHAPSENRVDSMAGPRKKAEPAAKTRQTIASSLPAAPAPKTSLNREAVAPANAPFSLPASGRAYAPVPMAQTAMAPAASAGEAASSKIAGTGSNAARTETMASAPALQVQKKDSAEAVQIPSPVAAVLWRVSAAGLIQRSTDAGKTWMVQPSGVVADLLSGSAPSEAICWVVGRNAAILLTTDAGQHWQRIHSPVDAEISGIFAASDQQATVTAGGQTYRTTDGGQTWSVLPNASNP